MKKEPPDIRAMKFEPPSAAAAGKRKNLFRSFLLTAVVALGVLTLAARISAQAPAQDENRFLFIISTSTATRRETNGIRAAVQYLLNTSMQGQMRDGDTFGLWNYDDQLHTEFPMQIWSQRSHDQIMDTVSDYLDGRTYARRTHLEKVFPALRQVMQSSRVITIIFIYDGSEAMAGTGFDKDINGLQKEFGGKMRSGNIPFVTVLAVKKGQVFEYTVNTPSSISMPKTADLIERPPTNAAPAVASAKPPPPAAKPPTLGEIVLTPTPPSRPAPVQPPPADPVKPAAQFSAGPAPPAPQPPAQSPNPIPAPAPDQTANLAANPAPPPAAPAAKESAPAPELVPAPIPAVMPRQVVSKPPSQPAAIPAPAPSQTASPAPAPPAVPAPGPRPVPVIAQTIVAVPSPQDHIALLLIAFSLLTIAVVLVVFLFRRSRAVPSLISQSMDRPR